MQGTSGDNIYSLYEDTLLIAQNNSVLRTQRQEVQKVFPKIEAADRKHQVSLLQTKLWGENVPFVPSLGEVTTMLYFSKDILRKERKLKLKK